MVLETWYVVQYFEVQVDTFELQSSAHYPRRLDCVAIKLIHFLFLFFLPGIFLFILTVEVVGLS
jgi:hypothetical protein